MGTNSEQVKDGVAPQLPVLQVELEVPFADIDCQKIVWHGNYLRYFELARVRMFEKCDLFPLIEEGLVDFVVSESYCKHYHPLRFRDRCTVVVSFADIDHRLNMRFLIEKDDGIKIAKGHTHVVTLDRKGKLQLVTPQIVVDRIHAAAVHDAPRVPSRRHFIAATGALLSTLALPGKAQANTLPESLKQLLITHRQSNGLVGRFVEEKHISLLKVPLKNEGRLAYLRPDTFARIVERPTPSKIVARGETLAFREGTGPKTELSLHNRPELKALVEGIIFLLAGNVAEIERHYTVSVKSCGSPCSVELVPKDEKMRRLVEKFVVHASSDRLESFEVHESSGDYSITRLIDLDLNHQFSEAEKKTLFSI